MLKNFSHTSAGHENPLFLRNFLCVNDIYILIDFD